MPACMHLHAISHSYVDAQLTIDCLKDMFSCNHPSTCDGKNDIKRQRPLSDATTEKTTSKDNVCFRMPACMHLHTISHSYVDAQLKLDCLEDMFSCNHPSTCDGKNDIKRQRPLSDATTEKTTSKDNVRSRMPHIFFMHDILHIEVLHGLKASL